MACYQIKNLPDNFSATGRSVYRTEADCLKACAEGACCEADGSCSIKQQCECDTENGAVFAGDGEACAACESCPDLGGSDSQIYNGTTLKATFSPLSFAAEQMYYEGIEDCDHSQLLSLIPSEISQPFAQIDASSPPLFTALWSDGNVLSGNFQNLIAFLCGQYYLLSFDIIPPLPNCIKGMMVPGADEGSSVYADPESIRWGFFYKSHNSGEFLRMVAGTPIGVSLNLHWSLIGYYVDPLTGRRTAHGLGTASSSVTIENLNPLP